MKESHTYNGFTLLEMSIVLVIIALLIGGIIAGKGFIRNSQLTTTMNDGRFYINAFAQFQSRYGAVPGDMANATTYWTGAHNGNGNNAIACNSSAANCAVLTPLEIFYAFEHLGLAGFINAQYPGTQGPNGTGHIIPAPITLGGTYYPANVPASPIANVAYYFQDPSLTGWCSTCSTPLSIPDGFYLHPLFIGREATGTNQIATNVFLRPREALQLDSKFDDGNGISGTIRAIVSPPGVTCMSVAGVYSATTNALGCVLILTPQ